LFKKRSLELSQDTSYLDELDRASSLIDKGHSCKKDGSTNEAVDNYQRARGIYEALFIGIPAFHDNFGHLYAKLDLLRDRYDNDLTLFDGAMFHLNEAAELYEQEKDYKNAGKARQAQARLLRSYGEDEKVEKYEQEAEEYERKTEASFVDARLQDTEEYAPITQEQLDEYHRVKEGKLRNLARSAIGFFIKDN
jgi:tetratricopeptide (TPR) repeat protein